MIPARNIESHKTTAVLVLAKPQHRNNAGTLIKASLHKIYIITLY